MRWLTIIAAAILAAAILAALTGCGTLNPSWGGSRW